SRQRSRAGRSNGLGAFRAARRRAHNGRDALLPGLLPRSGAALLPEPGGERLERLLGALAELGSVTRRGEPRQESPRFMTRLSTKSCSMRSFEIAEWPMSRPTCRSKLPPAFLTAGSGPVPVPGGAMLACEA